jgi:hypothetical protein
MSDFNRNLLCGDRKRIIHFQTLVSQLINIDLSTSISNNQIISKFAPACSRPFNNPKRQKSHLVTLSFVKT